MIAIGQTHILEGHPDGDLNRIGELVPVHVPKVAMSVVTPAIRDTLTGEDASALTANAQRLYR
jgi:hypothetical protein